RQFAGQRVAALDRRADRSPAGSGRQILIYFDLVRLLGQILIFDDVAKPGRVLAAAEMVLPCFIVDPFSNLQKQNQVLRLEVQFPCRAAKVEASAAYVPKRILARMATALASRRLGANANRFSSLTSPPGQNLPAGQFGRRNRWASFTNGPAITGERL